MFRHLSVILLVGYIFHSCANMQLSRVQIKAARVDDVIPLGGEENEQTQTQLGDTTSTESKESLQGNISGLSGSMKIKLNLPGSEKSVTLTKNGSQILASDLSVGDAFSVSVEGVPEQLACPVSPMSGTIAKTTGTNPNIITISCGAKGDLKMPITATVNGLASGESLKIGLTDSAPTPNVIGSEVTLDGLTPIFTIHHVPAGKVVNVQLSQIPPGRACKADKETLTVDQADPLKNRITINCPLDGGQTNSKSAEIKGNIFGLAPGESVKLALTFGAGIEEEVTVTPKPGSGKNAPIPYKFGSKIGFGNRYTVAIRRSSPFTLSCGPTLFADKVAIAGENQINFTCHSLSFDLNPDKDMHYGSGSFRDMLNGNSNTHKGGKIKIVNYPTDGMCILTKVEFQKMDESSPGACEIAFEGSETGGQRYLWAKVGPDLESDPYREREWGAATASCGSVCVNPSFSGSDHPILVRQSDTVEVKSDMKKGGWSSTTVASVKGGENGEKSYWPVFCGLDFVSLISGYKDGQYAGCYLNTCANDPKLCNPSEAVFGLGAYIGESTRYGHPHPYGTAKCRMSCLYLEDQRTTDNVPIKDVTSLRFIESRKFGKGSHSYKLGHPDQYLFCGVAKITFEQIRDFSTEATCDVSYDQDTKSWNINAELKVKGFRQNLGTGPDVECSAVCIKNPHYKDN